MQALNPALGAMSGRQLVLPTQSPTTNATQPKKRIRKPKDKSGPKSSKPKLDTNKSQAPVQTQASMQQNQFVSPAAGVGVTVSDSQYGMSQPSSSQLSPSVEQIVSEAWEMQQQNQQHHHCQQSHPSVQQQESQNPPEEDIMAVQLQSFLSGQNVSAGSGVANASYGNAFQLPNFQQAQPQHQQQQVPSGEQSVFSQGGMAMMSSGKATAPTPPSGFVTPEQPATPVGKMMPGQPMTVMSMGGGGPMPGQAMVQTMVNQPMPPGLSLF